jgi:hypothetical protein
MAALKNRHPDIGVNFAGFIGYCRTGIGAVFQGSETIS